MQRKELQIEQVAAPVTWHLRLEVMYPGGSLRDVQLPDDFEGVHFGAYLENTLVGVISLFPDGKVAQFRKFAVKEYYQGQGIGRALLATVLTFCQTNGIEQLWCHARTTAEGFYEQIGMRRVGDLFYRGTLTYYRMEIDV
ncbi:GNAT family N-acetyltransferase [Sphingobacterium psychroaquaticum]|uniref:Acetyltransferase (GNAT) domain-containing protein n=1 Tax=Sphingobacterium psychroaquaticum TaxID=561061 RepID=A0A1X7JJ66_9SPHI|nr:GNAT family N-acetyltransferase [Sphingobacterium psychroaquaticum]SMG27991.1 Acetyltransferase (GNAT) domain-containing protein [Sphingobacterium psychroaquaticum]